MGSLGDLDKEKRCKVISTVVFEAARVPLLIAIFVVGCLLVNELADDKIRYFEKKDDWTGDRCLVLLSPKSLEGDVIQLVSLEGQNAQSSVITTGAQSKDFNNSCSLANNGICDEPNLCSKGSDCWDCKACMGLSLPSNVQVDIPTGFDVTGAKVLQSEACNIVVKEEAVSGKYSFRQVSKDMEAMIFPACPTFQNETAEHAAQLKEVSRQLYGYDLTPASLTAIGSSILIVWLFLKLFGIITGFINIFTMGYDIIVNCGEDDKQCGTGLYELVRYCIYSLAPACVLGPFASVKVHDACPQIATMQLDDTTSWAYLAGVSFGGILLAYAMLRPCAPNNQVELALCERKGGTWRLVVFLVICANVVGFGMFFVGFGVAAKLDLPSLFFDLSGLFTWPDVTISMSADLIRLFMGILLVLEFVGLLKTVVFQIIGRCLKKSKE